MLVVVVAVGAVRVPAVHVVDVVDVLDGLVAAALTVLVLVRGGDGVHVDVALVDVVS